MPATARPDDDPLGRGGPDALFLTAKHAECDDDGGGGGRGVDGDGGGGRDDGDGSDAETEKPEQDEQQGVEAQDALEDADAFEGQKKLT